MAGNKVQYDIDGSYGEGGGQIVRNGIAYAAILGKANLRVSNIRAGRKKPGLKPQHVTGLRLAARICGGELEGDDPDSTQFVYRAADRKETSGQVTGDTGTAGSICLLLQTALPCALFGRAKPTSLVLRGGTNASNAPQYDYFEQILLPTLQRCLGITSDQIVPTCERRGYYPKGGGEVRVLVKPLQQPLPPISLTNRGEVCEIYIRSYQSGARLPPYLASGMAHAAKKRLEQIGVEPRVEIRTENSGGNGSGILVVAKTTTGCLLGGSALGRPKKPYKQVGLEAANELIEALDAGGCVDDWLQDQLIVFMALSKGQSEMLTGSLTLHTRTAIWLAQRLCGITFQVTKISNEDSQSSSTTTTITDDDDDPETNYGKDGRIPGKHLIRCVGIDPTTS